ncbi:MAG: biotin transporter BioY [Oscillibacter sp.]|jgi:biotin transport system substrate-specific component|nr:biotin transporter BioY [Oscillibacter sp.]
MDSSTSTKSGWGAADLAYIALGAVLIAVCAWISIPTTVPFTMQTFAIFTVVGLLGGRRGSWSVVVYLLMGAVGLPVFSNFQGGLGWMLGATGGYLIGFLGSALVYWLVTKLLGTKVPAMALGMVLGLLTCYIFGTAWFLVVYARTSGSIGLGTALGWCVIPFIVPDLLKIALALGVTKVLGKHVHL